MTRTKGDNDPDIDIVIAWVDQKDPIWQKKKNRCRADNSFYTDGTEDLSEARYRDWGTLKYLMRGIERYAPWVRLVHLVTDQQKPEWLNLQSPRLHLTDHRDIIKADALPTFNANAVEVNIGRIPGLAEHFIYFNDDMLITAPIRKKDFFVQGMPRDMLALQPVVANPDNPTMSDIYLNNALVISRHFRKWENMRKQPGAYFHAGYPALYFGYNILERVFPLFTGFYTVHSASPFLKHTFETLWNLEPEILDATTHDRYRSGRDVNQYLFREWQKLEGNFYPANVQRDSAYFELAEDNRRLYDALLSEKKKMICINDPGMKDNLDFDRVKSELTAILERAFPDKSSFEI
ncbi:MAG: Stealth CR1 domain-containing protein [Bilifractor sp.]